MKRLSISHAGHWLAWLAGIIALACAATAPALAQSKAAAAEISPLKSFGTKTAPVTLEVFSDFQCPACRELFLQTLRPLIDDYVASGRVYLVHRDMPLPMHKYSREAARFANAAARVHKFEAVAAALYTKQDVWSVDGNIEAVVAAVLSTAEMKQVRQLVRSGKLDAAIDKDVALGGTFQVRQTPTMIITQGGQTFPIVGVVRYNYLKLFLDDLLRR